MSLVLLLSIVAFSAMRPEKQNEYDAAMNCATEYYDFLIQKEYKKAIEMLYRAENTIFTDEFLLSSIQEAPPVFYKVESIEKLAENVYEISGIGKSNDNQGERNVKNYVIYYNSKYYFVIHWSDVPSELYDFRKTIGY